MSNNITCPICEEGVLYTRVGFNEVSYKEAVTTLPSCYSECNHCGSEQASSADVYRNKVIMEEFKKMVDESNLKGLE